MCVKNVTNIQRLRRRLTTSSITDQFSFEGLAASMTPWMSVVALGLETWLTMKGLDHSNQFRSRVRAIGDR